MRSVGTPQQPLFTLPTYEGPLDLLLQLIRENQVDIYDIPIAEITRQYLDRLAEWQALDLTIAGDYLVMAATLLEIKSRMLLPRRLGTDDEPEDPRAELARRLAEYQRYANVVEVFRAWEQYRGQLYFRGATEALDDYILPVEEASLRPEDLAGALRQLLQSAGVDEGEVVSAIVPRQRVSLKLKMAEVLRIVRRNPDGILFATLVDACGSLLEVAVTFLALLELLRRGRVQVFQRRSFGSLRIKALCVEAAKTTGTTKPQEANVA